MNSIPEAQSCGGFCRPPVPAAQACPGGQDEHSLEAVKLWKSVYDPAGQAFTVSLGCFVPAGQKCPELHSSEGHVNAL